MTCFLIFLTSMFSSFIQATTGFGFGILFMAISPYYLPYNIAQVLSLSSSPIGNTINALKRISRINWMQVLIPLIFATATSYLSIELTKDIDMGILKRVLGLLLVVLSVWFLKFSKKIKIKPTFTNATIVGLLSGIGAGLFSISGPPVVVYYLSALSDKEEYMATIQTYFLFNSLLTLGMRYFMGIFPSFSMLWFIASLSGIACGFFVGSKLYSKLNGENMKRFVYGFMALSGIWIFIKG